MRWSAIDLDAETPTISVRATRVSTAAGIVTQDDAKTISSRRTLPIPQHLLPILRRVRHEQVHGRVRLGERWEGGEDWRLLCHDLGASLSPRTLNAWWTRSLSDAGLPHRRLHASRHTAASLLALRGAPVPMIAAWLGHADGGVLAMRTYVHTPGAALGETAVLLSKGREQRPVAPHLLSLNSFRHPARHERERAFPQRRPRPVHRRACPCPSSRPTTRPLRTPSSGPRKVTVSDRQKTLLDIA